MMLIIVLILIRSITLFSSYYVISFIIPIDFIPAYSQIFCALNQMNVEDALEQERQTTTFNVDKMTQFLFPEPLLTDLKAAYQSNPILESDFNLFNEGRLAILKKSYAKIPQLLNDKDYNKQANIIDALYQSMLQMPGSVHLGMFIKCIEIMGTEEQQKQFILPGWEYKVIGCYAQTEIGHGSDVQSLQTTATFIEETGEIELHTPDITACKFWPGELGMISNYALVFAQLIMRGKKFGVHPFILRIRDDEWKDLPGIETGELGPKMGFPAKDNGYLFMNHVRIPRTNILGKFVQITRQGELKRLGDPLIGYATMMFIRQFISTLIPKVYGQGISIAVRYSVFRRQFKNKQGQEVSVFTYQTQQQKLIPRIAEYFAVTVGGNVLRKVCLENAQLVEKGDLSMIGETHACLCLGKAYYTEIVYDGLEICRRACGGHGFSHYSGLPNIINEFSPNLTHQGQNTVLYLQVARYILNNYKKHLTGTGKINQNAKYITSYDYFMNQKCTQYLSSNPQSWRLEDIRKLLAQVVCCLVEKATTKIMNKQVEGMNDMEFMGYFVGMNLQALARAHAVYFTFVHFVEAILQETHEQVRLVLISLCKLYGVSLLLANASPVIERGLVSKQHMSSLVECRQQTIMRLRPNTVGLVDSFYIPDSRLRSHLAKGNPYENYLQMARKCSINKKVQESAFIVKQVGKAIASHRVYPKL